MQTKLRAAKATGSEMSTTTQNRENSVTLSPCLAPTSTSSYQPPLIDKLLHPPGTNNSHTAISPTQIKKTQKNRANNECIPMQPQLQKTSHNNHCLRETRRQSDEKLIRELKIASRGRALIGPRQTQHQLFVIRCCSSRARRTHVGQFRGLSCRWYPQQNP